MAAGLAPQTRAKVVRTRLFVGAVGTVRFAIAKLALGNAMARMGARPHVGRALILAALFFIAIIATVVVIVALHLARYAPLVFAAKVAARTRLELACGRLVARVGTIRRSVADPRFLNALRMVGATKLVLEACRMVVRTRVLLIG
jgi:hypothetical protein